MKTVELYLDPATAEIRFIYSPEAAALLPATCRRSAVRASYVEPDAAGAWWADLSPVGGPRLGPFPFDRRDLALREEARWLAENILEKGSTWPSI